MKLMFVEISCSVSMLFRKSLITVVLPVPAAPTKRLGFPLATLHSRMYFCLVMSTFGTIIF